MNGYIGFYKGKRYEVYAETTFEAQKKLAERLNVKKRYKIDVYLVEKGGEDVVHVATE